MESSRALFCLLLRKRVPNCTHITHPLLLHVQEEGEDDELTPGYKAPKKVDLKTLQDLDADDESLVKYKQQLLGQTGDIFGMGRGEIKTFRVYTCFNKR